jgi:hypothetical protein
MVLADLCSTIVSPVLENMNNNIADADIRAVAASADVLDNNCRNVLVT